MGRGCLPDAICTVIVQPGSGRLAVLLQALEQGMEEDAEGFARPHSLRRFRVNRGIRRCRVFIVKLTRSVHFVAQSPRRRPYTYASRKVN
jgi:hypothetical protein